jgi:hypothetical protein
MGRASRRVEEGGGENKKIKEIEQGWGENKGDRARMGRK